MSRKIHRHFTDEFKQLLLTFTLQVVYLPHNKIILSFLQQDVSNAFYLLLTFPNFFTIQISCQQIQVFI